VPSLYWILGKIGGRAAGFTLTNQRNQSLLTFVVIAEGVLGFFQRQQHLLLVVGQGAFGIGIGATDPRSYAAQVKRRPGDARAQPQACAAENRSASRGWR
jgi:hypothetical protein